MKTLREKFIAALQGRGERIVSDTGKTVKMTRGSMSFYFIGKAGSLRVGQSKKASIPVHDKYKESLLGDVT